MKNTIQIKTRLILALLFSIDFVLIIWAPATQGSTLGSDTIRAITRVSYFVLPIIAILLQFFLLKLRLIVLRFNFFVICTVIIYYIITKFYVYSADIKMGSLSTMIGCIAFCLQDDDTKIIFWKIIKNILLIISIISIICYVSYIFHLGIPYKLVSYYAQSKHDVWYADYTISYLYINSVQARACGIFNEPGWFGTFIAFYLCTERLNLKRKQNIVIFVAGCLTFSLAFFLIIVVYFILNNITSWKKAGMLIAALFLYGLLPYVHTGNVAIDSYIGRISLISDSNVFLRTTTKFDYLFSKAVQNQMILVGYGGGYSEKIAGGGNLSITVFLLDYGITGVFLMFIPILIIMYIYAGKNKNARLFLLCVTLSLYQRPWLFEASNFMFTMAAMVYIVDGGSKEVRI